MVVCRLTGCKNVLSLDSYSRLSDEQRQKMAEALDCCPTDSKPRYSASVQAQGGQHKDACTELSVLARQEEAVTIVSYGGLLLNGQGAVFNNSL